MSHSDTPILPVYHSKQPTTKHLFFGRASNDKRILFTFLFFFFFICFSWLFLIPDPSIVQQRSYAQIYGDFAPHISSRVNLIHNKLPIPQPPQEERSRPQHFSFPHTTLILTESSETQSSISEGNSVNEKKEYVKSMMHHAWNGYQTYAFGQNELKPIAKTGHSPPILGRASEIGLTIVDSLDTLWIMGMREEFIRAREWVRVKFDLRVSSDISLFEANIRYVAGFIAIYTMTNDELFLEKAKECADLLLPAFNSPSGIPFSLINPVTGNGKSWGWAGGSSILAEIGTLHLEFLYLSYLTKDPIYYSKVLNIRRILKELPKNNGLYPNYINPYSKSWGQAHISLGALGDSFYEYLYKAYLITNRTDTEAKEMYYSAIEAIRKDMLKCSSTGLLFIGDLRNGRLENKMDHLGCFAGGLFALSSLDAPPSMHEDFLQIGEELTSTCHESYSRSDTKLGPEAFHFNGGQEAKASRPNEYVYLLRPETVESYFVLWRITGKQKYRDWAWDVVQALEKHTRTENGYSGIRSVYSIPTQFDDVQQSFFLAETLKYLYLIFCDDDTYSLDKWVFNTEAHPFPIIPGINAVPIIS